MPEGAIAEPTIEAEIEATPPVAGEEHVMSEGFGNLSEAFDKAFPSTAKKVEPAADPALEPGKPASTDKPTPATIEKKPEERKFADSVPESIFGDKKNADDLPPAAAEPEIKMPASITKPKDIESWKALRIAYETEKKERSREASEFARAIAEAKQQSVAPELQTQLEQLRQQNQELLATVERRSLEDHPQFRQQITMPREQAMNEARQLLSDSQIDPKHFDKAMSKSGPERIEALEEIYEKLPESAKAELASAVREVKRLDARKDELLKNAHGTVEQLTRQDKLAQHHQLQQQETQILQMADAAASHLADKQGFEAFKLLEGDDPATKKWNAGVEERKADAKSLLTKTTDPAQHAIAANLATACPFYREQMLNYRQRALAAEKELAEIKGAEPRLDGGGGNGHQSAEDDEKLTFAERVARNSGLR